MVYKTIGLRWMQRVTCLLDMICVSTNAELPHDGLQPDNAVTYLLLTIRSKRVGISVDYVLHSVR